MASTHSYFPPASSLPGAVRDLEFHQPVAAWENRVQMTSSCRDCDFIPKVEGAGTVVEENGRKVQIMHNGLKVLADSYYGPWMTEIISRLQGHHEPQEEAVFHELLKHLPAKASMIELGAFWSYYSLWFLKENPAERIAIAIEPDPQNLAVGQANAVLNGLQPRFLQACMGTPGPCQFASENAGLIDIERTHVPAAMQAHGMETLDLLHCDAQGAELEVIHSCRRLIRNGKIRFLFISTHSHQICGDPLMHQRCLRLLEALGARILLEHDVLESFSGDGLIVAASAHSPVNWNPPSLSRNRYGSSLFRNPAYDLAELLRSKTPGNPACAFLPAPAPSFPEEPEKEAGSTPFISYAQNMEDVMLWRALKNISQGFYVDIGAQDPVSDSVSCAFYLRGWSGLNVEPSPFWHARLVEKRLRDISLNLAVSSQVGRAPFWEIRNSGLSTLKETLAASHSSQGMDISKIEVETKPLKELLAEIGPREIHFLKIDAEGSETEVISSSDWTVHRPWIVVVEATEANSTKSSHQTWEPILLRNRYDFVYFDGLNRFYLAAEHWKLNVHFSSPPNVFDHFRTAREQGLEESLLFCQQAIATLQKQLEISEADRAQRLDVIHALSDSADALKTQVEELKNSLAEKENPGAAS